MRWLTFQGPEGPRLGLIKGKGVVDVSGRLGAPFRSLREALAADALGRAAGELAAHEGDLELAGLALCPVVPDPEKIICVGVNYAEHRAEMGRGENHPHPVIFARFANSQVGHGRPLVRPRASTQLDYEGELAVVIGRRGRHVPRAEALAHVAGYACYNDASVRDWQRHTHQFTPGKNFVGSGAFGPWLAGADEIADPAGLALATRVNGLEVQRASTADMIFDVPALIAYCSTFTELAPGDVLVTGTPGGVGSKRNPPLFLKAGDVVEVEIERVGLLRNPVVDEAP
ncbi:MAG TPA: fumarylacetoacetate hydrolase family protein [Polyangiaceae bacterium]|nr:fumarylacetoacetate hydrolase family protein [Polyangiaceae bacterium]